MGRDAIDPLRDSKNADRASGLYDLLADRDRTTTELLQLTGWTRAQVAKAVQVLRDILAADGDVINVVAEPRGQGQTWIYRLVGGNDIINAENSQWLTGRFSDTERRIKTIRSVLTSTVEATDGRTAMGRKARIYKLHLDRAQEEVALFEES